MAFNPFLGPAWTQPKLEAALASAQADLVAGKQVIRATVPGIDVTNTLELTIQERIRLIYKALHNFCPTQYPLDQITPATTTRVIFATTPQSSTNG